MSNLLYKYLDTDGAIMMLHYSNLMYANATMFNDPFDCYANVQVLDEEGLQKLIKKESCSSFEEQIYQEGLHK